MNGITVNIMGKDRIRAKFRNAREALLPRLQATMLQQMAKLSEYVRSSKLSGQVLRNITGTLRRSIHPSVTVDDQGVTGLVGTNVSYARVHEFGGDVQVPSFWRTQTTAFGKPIPPRSVIVKAHSAHYPERAFLRPSLNEQRDEIIGALRSTTRAVMNDS